MINKDNLKEIKNTIEEFFKKMTFEVEVRLKPVQDLTIPVDLETEEPKILIGERGQTLMEIQHLLKAILRRKIKTDLYLDLDVNDYKKKKTEYLKELARSTADEVVLLKEEKTLPSMSAYERRIIHLEIASRKDVVSESIGLEPERRVVIRPYP